MALLLPAAARMGRDTPECACCERAAPRAAAVPRGRTGTAGSHDQSTESRCLGEELGRLRRELGAGRRPAGVAALHGWELVPRRDPSLVWEALGSDAKPA